jgi:thiamine-monophosphate kinase
MTLQCWTSDKKVVISTDILVEGVRLGLYALKHLGYKAVTTNISDICCDDQKLHKLQFPLQF